MSIVSARVTCCSLRGGDAAPVGSRGTPRPCFCPPPEKQHNAEGMEELRRGLRPPSACSGYRISHPHQCRRWPSAPLFARPALGSRLFCLRWKGHDNGCTLCSSGLCLGVSQQSPFSMRLPCATLLHAGRHWRVVPDGMAKLLPFRGEKIATRRDSCLSYSITRAPVHMV